MRCTKQRHTAIQRSTRDVVELAPPSEVLPTQQVLENEADKEPRGIVDARRRRYGRDTVQNEGGVYIPNPGGRVPTLP